VTFATAVCDLKHPHFYFWNNSLVDTASLRL